MLNLRDKTILALGAHPDDIELGCLGLLLLAKGQGAKQIICACLTDGGSPARCRESEHALRDPFIFRFLRAGADSALTCNRESVGKVEKLIHQYEPHLVLTMTAWDTHQDHRAVEAITLAACRRLPVSILGYAGMSSTSNFQAGIFVDVSSVLESKLAAIRCHESQHSRSYMEPEFLTSWHHDRNSQMLGLHRTELYHVYRLIVQESEAHVRHPGGDRSRR